LISLWEGEGVAGIFESAARAAIEELVKEQAKPSKFGFFISEEGMNALVENLFAFFETSRNLKSAGDKLLSGGPPQQRPGAVARPPR
jgi:hypothetical protein